jgi:hypothetical protein
MSEASAPIEHLLKQALPAPLDPALLDRLDAAVSGILSEPTADESRMAALLAGVKPSAMPLALATSLEAALSKVPFTDSRSIVPFPMPPVPRASAPRPRHHRRFAAAAAAALFGALSAWWIPTRADRFSIAADLAAVTPPVAAEAASSGGFVPAGFRRGLDATTDHGVVWGPDSQPHRVLKVVYRETITLRDADGRTCEIEQPRVEYLLAPAKAD